MSNSEDEGGEKVKFEMKGFDKLEKRLKEIERKAKETIEKEWSFEELFTSDFMKKHTKYDSIEKFLKDSPADTDTQEEFDKRDKTKFDRFVKENSEFNNWEEFSSMAGNQLAKRELEKQGFKLE